MIPIDLITEILSRLPAKSITELFLTVSSARPRLLFALQHNGKWFFLSAPQPLNPDQNSSSLVVDHHKPFPRYFSSSNICALARGLICTNSRNPMICNPSTRQCITLPETASVRNAVRTFFGYDLIKKIFKVLSVYKGYRVLTLGSGELSWRMIDCLIPQFPLGGGNGICIKGVLYYLADSGGGNGFHKPFMVVCFDVRLEKFKFQVMDNAIWCSTLINCKGRLGVFQYNREDVRIELLVLDDADEQKWSKHIYVLPPL